MSNATFKVVSVGCSLGFLLLCSCATPRTKPAPLPPEITINQDASRGHHLIVTLQMENGDAVPLLVDTGTTGTFFDKSMEPKLGEPTGTTSVRNWGKILQLNVYRMPQLYLEDVPLMTASNVVTHDFKDLTRPGGPKVMGILGMDMMKNYCIQFDFAARKMRFLDSKRMDRKALGKAFPIVPLTPHDSRPAIAENLIGVRGSNALIDSGYDTDGWLMPTYYQQWTNTTATASNQARFPNGLFGDELYENLLLRNVNVKSDGIGLRFLARHLVTLDFPNSTMYLSKTNSGKTVSAVKQ